MEDVLFFRLWAAIGRQSSPLSANRAIARENPGRKDGVLLDPNRPQTHTRALWTVQGRDPLSSWVDRAEGKGSVPHPRRRHDRTLGRRQESLFRRHFSA